MEENKHILDIDIKNPTYIDDPEVRQNDDVYFVVNITDDGQPYDLTNTSTITLAVKRNDKVIIISPGVKTDINQVTFKLPKSSVATVGKSDATVQMYDAENRVSTFTFPFNVVKDPSGTGWEPSDGEKTLIQVVLGEGPAILADAERATDEADIQASRAETATENAEQATLAADTATANALQAKDDAVIATTGALDAKGQALDAAAYATQEADDARAQKEMVEQVLQDGPVASVNGQTGIVTGLAKQEDMDSVTSQLADTAIHAESFFLATEADATGMIQRAIDYVTTNKKHLIFQPKPYSISSKIIIPDNAYIDFRFAELIPTIGFEFDHALEVVGSNVMIDGLLLEGINLPIVTDVYKGTVEPRGVGIRVRGSAENRLKNISIENSFVSNTPFPGVFATYVDDINVSGNTFENCSNNVSAGSPANVTLEYCTDMKTDNNIIERPGMKGISFGNSSFGSMRGNKTTNGNVGHAAYYLSNSTDIEIEGNFASEGFGIKLSRGNKRVNINGNKFKNLPTGIYTEGSDFVTIADNFVTDSTGDAIQVAVHPTYAKGTKNIIVKDNQIEITKVTPTNTQNGIRLISQNSLWAESISVTGNKINGAYYGIVCLNPSNSFYKKLLVSENEILNTYDTAISLKGIDLKVLDNIIDGVTVNHGVVIAGNSDNVGSVHIDGNSVKGITANGLLMLGSLSAKALNVNKNNFDTVGTAITLSTSNLSSLILTENTVDNVTLNNQIMINGNIGVPLNVVIEKNILPSRRIYFATTSDITGFVDHNVLTSITDRPAKVRPLMGADSPEGIITASIGESYINTNGGENTTLYVKTTGTGNTGWVAK